MEYPGKKARVSVRGTCKGKYLFNNCPKGTHNLPWFHDETNQYQFKNKNNTTTNNSTQYQILSKNKNNTTNNLISKSYE